jgi:hypothetical protein
MRDVFDPSSEDIASDTGALKKCFFSDVTNPRECPVKKLSVSWIAQKLNKY